MDLGEEFKKHFEDNPYVNFEEDSKDADRIGDLLEIVLKNQTDSKFKTKIAAVIRTMILEIIEFSKDETVCPIERVGSIKGVVCALDEVMERIRDNTNTI
jgi:hypothetical protein